MNMKYRVWDTFNNIMVYDPYMIVKANEGEFEGGEAYGYFGTWNDKEDGVKRPCHVMAFIGKADDAGKDVYSGYIVKFRQHPDKMRVGVVQYSNQRARFEIKYYSHQLEKDRGSHSIIGFGTLNKLEVIGDIYQNPKLFQ